MRQSFATRRARALCAAAALGCALPAAAQTDFPAKPIRVIVPLAPGGGNDLVARMVGSRLQERLGQAIVVDNRPGVGGVVGTEIASRATPDGYTLLVANNSHPAMGALYPKLSFDPVRDFAPVTLAAISPLVVAVHPSVPFKTFGEFLAWTRAHPGRVHYGTSGVGSPPHLAGELIAAQAKIDLTPVPFKGIAPALTAVLGNEIQMTFANLPVSMPHVHAGRLRALAITSAKRSEALPDLPTVAESGLPGFEASIWFGFLAPAGTPRAILERLNREIVAVLRLPEVRQQLVAQGVETVASSIDEFAAIMKNDAARLGKLIRERGIKAD